MEHYWELFPVSMIPEATHTILEVIHSSNREHRHELKANSTPGYYSFLWSVAISDDEEQLNDFDELLKYSVGDKLISGLQRKGRSFKSKDLSLAVKKVLPFIDEIKKINLVHKHRGDK